MGSGSAALIVCPVLDTELSTKPKPGTAAVTFTWTRKSFPAFMTIDLIPLIWLLGRPYCPAHAFCFHIQFHYIFYGLPYRPATARKGAWRSTALAGRLHSWNKHEIKNDEWVWAANTPPRMSPAACMSSPLCVRNGGNRHLKRAAQTRRDVYEWISLCFATHASRRLLRLQQQHLNLCVICVICFSERSCCCCLFFFLSSPGWCCDTVVTDRPAPSSVCRRRWGLPIVFRLRGNYMVAPSVSAGAFPAARRCSQRVVISCEEIWSEG